MKSMNSYLLLGLTIALASANGTILHIKRNDPHSCGAGFNAIVCAVWVPLLPLIGGVTLRPTGATVLWGCVYGVAMAGFFFTKTGALGCGPIGPTTMIGSCSMLIPTLAGAALFGEKIAPAQAAGLALLLCSFALNAQGGTKRGMSRRWLLYCIAFFAFSGLTGLTMKAHQNSLGKAEIGTMLWISALVSTGMFLLMSAPKRQLRTLAKEMDLFRWVCAVLCGVVSCLYNRINTGLSGALPGVVFFPIYNGGVILLNAVLGRLFFKEKLGALRLIGLGLGILAILLLGGVFTAGTT